MGQAYENDVGAIRQIKAVPSILDVICKVTGMGFVTVARVTGDKWIACEVLDNIDFGLKPGGELRVETTICNEIRQSHEAVVIDHVAEDQTYHGHHTPVMYGFQSYISMPIILSDGSFFGTLCAIDPRPKRLNTPEIIGMFKLFAELIAVHLDARTRLLASDRRLAVSQTALLDERNDSELREQFIAVLGHDLRNPLAAISGGTQLLLRRTEDEKSRAILRMMTTTLLRMGALIENVMDFARGRLGGGISLQKEEKSLEPVLTNVIAEIKSAFPDRRIDVELDIDYPFDCDHVRLGQLLSNLLGNAVTHGAEDEPILVEARTGEDGLTLAVVNGGKPIPPDALERLFQPFQRGEARASPHGLGLGLYIASEIARAHGGTLDVTSDERETRFTLTIPAPSQ